MPQIPQNPEKWHNLSRNMLPNTVTFFHSPASGSIRSSSVPRPLKGPEPRDKFASQFSLRPTSSFHTSKQVAIVGGRVSTPTASNSFSTGLWTTWIWPTQPQLVNVCPTRLPFSQVPKMPVATPVTPDWRDLWQGEVRRERHSGPNELQLKYLPFADLVKTTTIQTQRPREGVTRWGALML